MPGSKPNIAVNKLNPDHKKVLDLMYGPERVPQVDAYQKVYKCGRDTARANVCELLTKTSVIQYIHTLTQKNQTLVDYTFEDHVRNLHELVQTTIGDIYDFKDGEVTMKPEVDPKSIKAVKKVTQTVKTAESKDGTVIFKEVKTNLEMYDRHDAMKTLGMVLGYNGRNSNDDGINPQINNFFIQLNQHVKQLKSK